MRSPSVLPKGQKVLLGHASTLAAILCLTGTALGQVLVPPPPPPPPPPVAGQEEGLPQAPPSVGTFRIAGRVVDAADGQPLRHATVTLFANAGGARNPATEVETTDTGAFSIPNLPAGKYRLQGAARGYITAAYDAHGQYASAIVTGAGLNTESLVLRLEPAAMLSGRVTDEAGDPIRNAMISLFHENTDQGIRKITMFRQGNTNDLGAYEITRLPPGTYYACVRAVPWYAAYPPPEQPGANFGVAADVDPALNVVYPLTFYPAAADSAGASPMTLKAGDRYHADFHLTPQPAMHLTVQMPAANGAAGRNMPQLQQKVFDAFEPVMQQRAQVSGSNVEIQGLAAGNYLVRQFGQGGFTGPSRTVSLTGGSATLDATDPSSFGAVTLLIGPTESKLPQTLRLALRKGQPGEPAPTNPIKDGQVQFPNVEPGNYRIEPLNTRWHVDAVTLDGKTQPGALLHVTGDGQTATITLGAGVANVTGYVRREDKGVSGAMVVLVPAAGDHSIELYRRDQSDLDGSFSFAAVVPGNYLLVAITDGWSLEWGKPEALAPYLAKAVPVTVPADSRGPMKLAEAVPAQPR